MDYVKTLHEIAKELVVNKDKLEVRQMPSLDDNIIVLYVYATHEDIAKLIGKKGMMANSIRQMLQVASKIEKKHVSIKFEAL